MKILVDLRKLSNKPSGIGVYTYQFIKGIVNENDKINIIGITDVLISDEIKELKNYKIKIFEYGKEVNKNFEVIKYFKYIQKIILSVEPDIFWEPNNIIPRKIKNPYGKIVTTIHDIFPITSKENYSLIYRWYFNLCMKKTLKMSELLIYVSNFTKNEVEINYKDAKNKRSIISYNIVDIKKVDSENILDNNYFLYIGNIEKRKGIDLLIKAFSVYIHLGGNKKLYIAGDLRDKSIKSMIDSINLEEEIIKYKGYISNEEKINLLAECSAFIFPSKAEGFGIPPIEAMIYNKNCIVSNIDIFKEILGESAIYFNFNESESETINNLAHTLFNYSNLKDNYKRNIINKYSSKKLSKNLITFFKNNR